MFHILFVFKPKYCPSVSFLSLLTTHLSIWQQRREHFSQVLIKSNTDHFKERFMQLILG